MRRLFNPFYSLLERHGGYALVQKLGRPTVLRFRRILQRCFKEASVDRQRVLDLACGVGAYRDLFPANYFGIDINPDYIRAAASRYRGSFQVMDCRALAFGDDFFDQVVTIAATHHLDDDGVRKMVAEALRVVRPSGRVRVIDAILPRNRLHLWKEAWFRLDRGACPRRAQHLVTVLSAAGKIDTVEFHDGPLHDVIHVCLVK
jgi:SAM-dependent methyltransferase